MGTRARTRVTARSSIVVVGQLTLLAMGCGLNIVGQAIDTDAAAPSTTEGGVRGDGGGDGGNGTDATVLDDGATCARDDAGCLTPPAGWTVVAVDPTRTASCPFGFAGTAPIDEGETPSAMAAGACTCATCVIGQPGSCTSGAVKIFYDNGGNPTCDTAGAPAQNNNNPAGQCGTDIFGGPTKPNSKWIPPAPIGGSCTAAGKQNKDVITYAAKIRVCHADNVGGAAPPVAAPFAVCIEAAGNQTCPAPFTKKHDVGSDVSFNCPDCSCATNTTCSGTMTYYTDVGCTQNAVSFVADGVCRASGTTQSFQSYKFAGTGVTACSVGAPGAATNIALVSEKTICCTP